MLGRHVLPSLSVRRHSEARGRQREIESTQKISSPSRRQGILDIVLAMDLYYRSMVLAVQTGAVSEVEVAVLGFPS